MRAVLVCLAVLLAGCTGSDDPGTEATTPTPTPPAGPGGTTSPTPGAPTGPSPTPPTTGAPPVTSTPSGIGPSAPRVPAFTLTGCDNLSGTFPVPFDAAQALLPEGFAAVSAGEAPAPTAVMFVVMADCDGATVDGVDVGEAQVGYAELQVSVPASYQNASAADYTVPVVFAARPEALGDKVAALGLGRAGSSGFTRTDTPAAIRMQMAVDGVSLDLSGALAPNPATIQGAAFRVIGVQDKTVRSVLDGVAAGGSATQAALAFRGTGDPLLEAAQPASRGGSVTGYDLSFTMG